MSKIQSSLAARVLKAERLAEIYKFQRDTLYDAIPEIEIEWNDLGAKPGSTASVVCSMIAAERGER